MKTVNKEPGICKVPNGYRVKVSTRHNGKRIQKQKNAKNLQEARSIKKILEEELSNLIRLGNEKKVGDFQNEFLDYLKTTLSEATFYRQQGIYKDQIFAPLRSINFSELSLVTFEKLYNDQVGSKSNQTKRHFLTYLNKFNDRAVQLGYLNKSLVKSITRPKRQKQKLCVLTKNELGILLSFLKKNHKIMYYHAALSAYTGLRASELRALKWVDIDEESRMLNINKTLTRKHGERPYTKNGEDRYVPINNPLMEILNEIKSDHFDSSDALILPYWREFWSDEQAKALKSMCHAANVKPIRWHDLRASFITEMISNNVPLDKVMNVVGHKLISTTQEYFRIRGRQVKGATESLNYSVDS